MDFAYIFLAPPSAIQIAVVVVIILLLFGGKKIPDLMRGLGSGIKEVKDATKDKDDNKTEDSTHTKEKE